MTSAKTGEESANDENATAERVEINRQMGPTDPASHAEMKSPIAQDATVPNQPKWNEIYDDAVELESLLFCIRRPTTRGRLFKFINNLKLLSGKLKRHEEVSLHLSQNTSTTTGKRSRDESADERIDESDKISSDEVDQPRAKKPRAIPLESFTTSEDNETNEKNKEIQNHESQLLKSFDLVKPPSLKSKDKWVQHHAKKSNQHCPDFDESNCCPLGSKCNYFHVFDPAKKESKQESESDVKIATLIFAKEDLDFAYETFRNISLTKTDYAEKIKTDELNSPNYSCSITCPIDQTIYYAQPLPGYARVKANRSHQGIWWYKNMKNARDAISTLIIYHLQERGIVPKDFKPRGLAMNGMSNAGKRSAVHRATQLARKVITSGGLIKEKNTAPPILPDITPWNWMESRFEKRCAQFNTPEGCSFGSNCQYAHVHFPTELKKDFPAKSQLSVVYKANFNMTLEDSFFHGAALRSATSPFRVMTAVDNRGSLWYTAALKCPREGIIYYAAGGRTGMLNKQNMVLYPSVEDAKLAVAGVVIDSFKKRGMVTTINTPVTVVATMSAGLNVEVSTAPRASQPEVQPMNYTGGMSMITTKAPLPPPRRRNIPIKNNHQQQQQHQSQHHQQQLHQQQQQQQQHQPPNQPPHQQQQIIQIQPPQYTMQPTFQHNSAPLPINQTAQGQFQVQQQAPSQFIQAHPMQMMVPSSLPPPPPGRARPPPPPPVRSYGR